VEAAGIELGSDSDATDNSLCTCEKCQECRAARALHLDCLKGHFLASLDADLQRLIGIWDQLAVPIRSAILALADSLCPDRSTTDSHFGCEL